MSMWIMERLLNQTNFLRISSFKSILMHLCENNHSNLVLPVYMHGDSLFFKSILCIFYWQPSGRQPVLAEYQFSPLYKMYVYLQDSTQIFRRFFVQINMEVFSVIDDFIDVKLCRIHTYTHAMARFCCLSICIFLIYQTESYFPLIHCLVLVD